MRSRRALFALALLALVAGGFAVVTALPASAFTVTVNTSADELNADGDCSLREAIAAANTDAAVDDCDAGSGFDVIVLPAGTYAPAATLTTTDADGVLLAGVGATITGSDTHRIIDVVAGDLTVQSISLVHGDAGSDSSDRGGAIRIDGGVLELQGATLSQNHAAHGGAVDAATANVNIFDSTLTDNLARWNDLNGNGGAVNLGDGELNVRHSTFTGNTAVNAGGAILTGGGPAEIETSTFSENEGSAGGAVYAGDEILIANSTFDRNSSTFDENGVGAAIEGALFTTDVHLRNVTVVDSLVGAGLDLPRETTLSNSIVAGNAAGDCETPVTSLGGNVTGDDSCSGVASDTIADPDLGPLANNGGPTLTRLPAVGSPAIDGGIDEGCQENDQRDEPRPRDGDGDGTSVCDSGAVEVATFTTDDPDTPGGPEAPRAEAVDQAPTFTG